MIVLFHVDDDIVCGSEGVLQTSTGTISSPIVPMLQKCYLSFAIHYTFFSSWVLLFFTSILLCSIRTKIYTHRFIAMPEIIIFRMRLDSDFWNDRKWFEKYTKCRFDWATEFWHSEPWLWYRVDSRQTLTRNISIMRNTDASGENIESLMDRYTMHKSASFASSK